MDVSSDHKAYFRSFNEWFADNVAKWATSAEKPRGVVEQFFSDLGAKLREFFQSAPEMHKPDVTLAAWLDTLGAKGVGEAAAQSIVDAREQSPFISIEDLRNRTKISASLIDLLREGGCLGNLPESNQTTLFSF